MIRLFSGPLSLFSRKVEIALAEKGLAFDREMVAFTQERGYEPKHPTVLAINPKAQVPVMIDDGLEVHESTVILEYLEDRYPTPPLYPRCAVERAKCRLLELTADEIMLVPVAGIMYRTEPPHPHPDIQEDRVEAGRRAEAELLRHYSDLNNRLDGRDYLLTEFTVADIAIFMTLHFARRLKGPDFTDYPNLDSWFDRMRARPAVAKVAAEIAKADRQLSPQT